MVSLPLTLPLAKQKNQGKCPREPAGVSGKQQFLPIPLITPFSCFLLRGKGRPVYPQPTPPSFVWGGGGGALPLPRLDSTQQCSVYTLIPHVSCSPRWKTQACLLPACLVTPLPSLCVCVGLFSTATARRVYIGDSLSCLIPYKIKPRQRPGPAG